MQNSMWKLATLLGVVGVGCLVVMQVQKNLANQNSAVTQSESGGPTSETDSGSEPFGSADGKSAFDLDQFEPSTNQFEPAGDQFEPAGDQFEPKENISQASYEQSAFGSGDTPPVDQKEFDFGGFSPSETTTAAGESAPPDLFVEDSAPGTVPAAPPGTVTAAAPTTPDPLAPSEADAFGTPFGEDPAPGADVTLDNGADSNLWGADNDRPASSAAPASTPPQELPPIEDAFSDTAPPAGAGLFEEDPPAPQPGRVEIDLNAPELPGLNTTAPAPVRQDPETNRAPASSAAPATTPFDAEPFEPQPFDTTPQAAPRELPPVETDPSGGFSTGPPVQPVAFPDTDAAPDLANPSGNRAGMSDAAPGIRANPNARYSDKNFESVPHGTLRPQLRIEKTAPASASIGQPLIYAIRIRNVGNAVANDVVVEDQIPQGAKLTGTIPQAELIDGLLVWRFEQLQPEQQQEIRIRVIPEREGQIGSVATVNFKAEIGAQTTVTAPKLKLSLEGQKEAKVGETIVFRYRIANEGTGDATNVWIRNPLPPQLQHPEGSDLEYEVGDLPAGAARDVTLQLVAAGAGEIRNAAVVTADGGVSAPGEANVSILGAQLQVTRRGPARRYIGRNAVYENVVTNTTHRDAENATLIEHIPEGMKFVKATDGGQYNELKRTVAWAIPKVGSGESLSFRVQLMPTQAGSHESIVQIVEDTGFKARANSVTQIVHLNNMGLQLSELDGPVSVGEKVVFTITVRNRGTSTATRSVLMLDVPKELHVTEAGPVAARQQGTRVEFDAVPEIAPGESKQFQIAFDATGVATDVRLRASIQSDQMQQQLITEESITIYDDSQ